MSGQGRGAGEGEFSAYAYSGGKPVGKLLSTISFWQATVKTKKTRIYIECLLMDACSFIGMKL